MERTERFLHYCPNGSLSVTSIQTYEVHSLRLDLNTLMEFLYNWLPQLANLKLVTDTGVLAGELAPAMDEELGKIFDKEGRR